MLDYSVLIFIRKNRRRCRRSFVLPPYYLTWVKFKTKTSKVIWNYTWHKEQYWNLCFKYKFYIVECRHQHPNYICAHVLLLSSFWSGDMKTSFLCFCYYFNKNNIIILLLKYSCCSCYIYIWNIKVDKKHINMKSCSTKLTTW